MTVRIDGSFGEGGGQILRTSLTLAALTGEEIVVTNIRAGRSKPGLRPQHLTAVRAVASICDAQVQGDELGSQRLIFKPGGPTKAGEYSFDVRDAARGGSAGSAVLIAQTILLPLARAEGISRVTLRGGTHVAWSPPFHYFRDVFLPAVERVGVLAEASLQTWGWYPVGGGEINLTVRSAGQLLAVAWVDRGELKRVVGLAAVTNLPAHIPQRMADRSRKALSSEGIPCQVEALRARGPAAGAGIFLTAEYDHSAAGFSALGRRGKPAEKVAEEACAALLQHHQSGAAVDPHLADQLVLPLALAAGTSSFTTSQVTQHLMTNLDTVQRFMDVGAHVERSETGGTVSIKGIGSHV